jgi:Protein of unknown function (DUF2612)
LSAFVFNFPQPPSVESAVDATSADIDHVRDALARLKEQHKNKPNIDSLLRSAVEAFVDLESAFLQLLLERDVNTAIGKQLDDIGLIVGERRLGLSDTDYRPRIRARILTNRSKGRASEIITIARLILNDPAIAVTLVNYGQAAYVVRLDGVEVSETLADLVLEFVKHATVAGTRATIESAKDTNTESFYTGRSSFLSAPVSAGATILPVGSTSGFPVTGSLTLSEGTTTQETVTYSGVTATSFTGVSPTIFAQPQSAQASQVGSLGKGLGTTTNAAIGGKLLRARS